MRTIRRLVATAFAIVAIGAGMAGAVTGGAALADHKAGSNPIELADVDCCVN